MTDISSSVLCKKHVFTKLATGDAVKGFALNNLQKQAEFRSSQAAYYVGSVVQ